MLLLAWLFGSFIEGSAGFGTPALNIAPLLSALGFPLQISVALPLLADTTAVVFGAVGTPVKIGFAGLDIPQVATTTALINLCTGFIVTILLIWILKVYHPEMQGLKIQKFILNCYLVGFCFYHTFLAFVTSGA